MKIETIKSKGFAVSVMLFPLMLLAGFLMHPDLLVAHCARPCGQVS